MNASSLSHIPEDALETYAVGRLDSKACAVIEEHLLICEDCQIRLAELDQYIRVVKAAVASMNRSSPEEPPANRKQPASAEVLV